MSETLHVQRHRPVWTKEKTASSIQVLPLSTGDPTDNLQMHPSGIEKDYYSILGSPEDVSQDEIVRIYKRLAARYHPDRGGNAEDMKAINEAYCVLGNETTRRAYDLRRRNISNKPVSATTPPLSAALVILPDTTFGRCSRALFVLFGGLVFLFFINIIYLRFMWPMLLLAIFVVFFGVWKLHEAINWERNRLEPTHIMRHHAWAQESAFWLLAGVGAYAVYRLISSM